MLSCVFVTYLCVVRGQVWYLIVSIPDLYLLSYFNCTVNVKLININYKYRMRIIPNNKYLFKCKSVVRDFCSMQEETNVHLFRPCLTGTVYAGSVIKSS